MIHVCVDTGLITAFFDANSPHAIQEFWELVEKKQYQVQILQPTLTESLYHLCKSRGKDYALVKIKSFQVQYTIGIVELDENIIYQAGILKCQNRETLSYNDCFSIAYCLIAHLPFYTTEKKLKTFSHPILEKLKVVPFKWD